MNVVATDLPGVLILEPKVFGDDRGFFFESYNERVFREKTGLDAPRDTLSESGSVPVKDTVAGRGQTTEDHPPAGDHSKRTRTASSIVNG